MPMGDLMKFICILLIFSIISCSTTYKKQNPLGQNFPVLTGKALDGKRWVLPKDFKNKPVILLIGYKQRSQFDIDRWLIGLDQYGVKLSAYEVPAIQGMIPRMLKTSINSGMRNGIPVEIWSGVITLYKDGEKLQAFTGNEKGNNARIMVLDPSGKIVYFYDRGFSVQALKKLDMVAKKLK